MAFWASLFTSSRLAGVRAVLRHEWRQLVYAPGTYVLQSGFLLMLAACVFVVAQFLDSDFASLDLMWTFLPWAALVFVPAFAMRAFSKEGGDSEGELTATMPLSSGEIVVGKWLAGTALLLVTLCFSLPAAATVAYLGSPDWGAVAGGYLGAGLLLTSFYAVGLFASALTDDRTSAYVLAIAVLSALTLAGFDQTSRVIGLPGSLFDAFANLSPKINLARLATGNLEIAAVANFAILTALALFGAIEALSARRSAPATVREKLGYLVEAILAVTVGIALMTGLSQIDLAADITQQREHTLSNATVSTARKLPPNTSIDLYWSEHEAGVPAHIKDYAHRIQRLSQAIARKSGGRLTVNTHDTSPDTEAEWMATARGIRRVPLSSGDHFFLGAVLSGGTRTQAIEYFDVDRARLLEYDLALALAKIASTHVPKVGLLSPLFTPSNVSEPREGLSILEELKRSSDVAIIPFFAEELPNDLDVLVVIGGGGLKPAMLYEIDQFVLRGKGLIVCLDPRNRFNSSSDAVVPAVTGRHETIADVLASYGVKFEAEVTGDALLAAPIVSEDQQKTTYPFWLRVKRAQISSNHPVTASLNELLLVEPGYLTHAPTSTVVDLVTTTDRSGSVAPGKFKGQSPAAASALFVPDGIVRTLAAFAPGPLRSAFPGPENPSKPHIASRSAPAAVFVVADVDWLFDPASVENAGTPAARPLNDNHALLANMIEYAGNDVLLAEIRSRGGADRRFTRVEEILKAQRARFGAEESEATVKIAKIEAIIAEVLQATKAKSISELPANIRAEIEKLQIGLVPTRRRLREIRLATREDIQSLQRSLTFANFAAGPILVLSFALAIFSLRQHGIKSNRAAK